MNLAIADRLDVDKLRSLDFSTLDSVRFIGPMRLPLEVRPRSVRVLTFWMAISGKSKYIVILHGSYPTKQRTLLRIESACIFGHSFSSRGCDCGFQLRSALGKIAAHDPGMLVYCLDQEGKGIGLENHFSMYVLRQGGLSKEEAARTLKIGTDKRSYDEIVTILRFFGVKEVTLLTNSPGRVRFLRSAGIDVRKHGLLSPVDANNLNELSEKKDVAGYDLNIRSYGDILESLESEIRKNDQARLEGWALLSREGKEERKFIGRNSKNLSSHVERKIGALREVRGGILVITRKPCSRCQVYLFRKGLRRIVYYSGEDRVRYDIIENE